MAEKTRNDENRAPGAQADDDVVVLKPDAEVGEMSLAQTRKKLQETLAALQEKQNALEQMDKELAEYKDKYLRVLAESENSRKRIRQQAEESARIQREGLLRDLLSIIDNLERAVAAARDGGNGKPIVEGVEMVLRSMIDFLRSHGVTQMSAVGQPFDPTLHEAVDSIESSQHEPNTVVDEFVRGYSIGDRLLRPARVTVSKAPGSEGGTGSGQVENH